MSETVVLVLRAFIPLGIMGLVFGGLLGFAGKIFAVEQDPRIADVMNALPGANCGACGYAGCSAFAEAVVAGTAPANGCAVSNDATAQEIARIVGVETGSVNKMRAQVMCSGTADKARKKFNYYGIMDCVSVTKIGGGDKECPYGCVGYGTCVKVCPFNAIRIEDNVAVVDYEKCVGCGLCEKACPQHIIRLVPYASEYWVGCVSKDKCPMVRSYCSIGCIGCGICEKNCPTGAIKLENSIAKIDYDLCIQCGTCFEKCPRSTILFGEFVPETQAISASPPAEG